MLPALPAHVLIITSVVVGVLSDLNVSNQVCRHGGNWRPELQICSCNYTRTGSDCSVWKYQQCYFGDGFDYRGQLSRTKAGERCSPWTTDHNNNLFPLGQNGIGLHNYCRNPDRDAKGLWCYVDGSNFMDYCNASVCPENFKENDNPSHRNSDDGSNETVRVLYGPLISGVCGGIIILFIIITVSALYRRRSCRCFANKRTVFSSSNAAAGSEVLQTVNVATDELPDPKFEDLGKIYTINMDTGQINEVA